MCSLFGRKKTENREGHEKVRRHIYFSGRVQGVGLRYRAVQAAIDYHLTGWVQNLSDGRVEMEVQGRESDIERLIQSLMSASMIHIDHMDICEHPVKADETGFREKGW